MMSDVRNKSRQNRLRAALRENLKRRKQQVRGRATRPAPEGTAPGESAGTADGQGGDAGKGKPELSR